VIRQDGTTVIVDITSSLFPFISQADLEAFSGAARSVDLDSAAVNISDTVTASVTQPSENTTKRERTVGNRTSEIVMRVAALQVAAGSPDGKATMTQIKNEVHKYVDLTPEDRLPSKTRPNEAMYQQIVGNIVSHRQSRNNIFALGWATYTGDGIQITEAGRHYLKKLGFNANHQS
jgi:hypothetical protein